jgi:hypothetical protein
LKNRLQLTLIYGLALAVVMALNNIVDLPDVALLAVWLLASGVGFLVGRWWVVFAVCGAILGRAIGWDSAENDGNPALWPPYVVSTIVLVGAPLLLGVAAAMLRNDRQRRHA